MSKHTAKAEAIPNARPVGDLSKSDTPSIPDQKTLVFIAAMLTPDEAILNPAVALKRAARLWVEAGTVRDAYVALLESPSGELLRFLASEETSLGDWRAKNPTRPHLEIGDEKHSQLLEYVNASLPTRLRFKTLANLRRVFIFAGPEDGRTTVDAREADEFSDLRKSLDTYDRDFRRKNAKESKKAQR